MRVIGVTVLCMGMVPCAALSEGGFMVGESDFVYSSDLAIAGFETFATSGASRDIYGMRKEDDMYLCHLADTPELQQQRQAVLLQEIAGKAPDRTIPNIPVICVLTQ